MGEVDIGRTIRGVLKRRAAAGRRERANMMALGGFRDKVDRQSINITR